MQNQNKNISRRSFIHTAALTAATVTIVPRHVLGGPGHKAPSDTLNIGCVGIGGKGKSDVRSVASENIIALCDVDLKQASKRWGENETNAFDEHPKARVYTDFRKMLDQEKDLDAITVSTPDHTHAVIAMAAMKMGKHVFVQKPLTKTVHESRMLAKAAKKYGVVTQMGNQGHAGEGARLINEWIWDGAIGNVTEVQCWTNRPVWPQGIEAPRETPSVPHTLDWDLWLGPALFRHYHPEYMPFNWRGWKDFGVGAIGDMGAHILDHPYWALDLGFPTKIQATSTKLYEDSYPSASITHFEFPARGDKPPVKLSWYDGGLMPPRPDELEDGRNMRVSSGSGMLFIGDKGKLLAGCYGHSPRIIPETKMREYDRPEKTIPRSPGIHQEWINAIKDGKKSTTDFSYSAPLTEVMLLGMIAILVQDQNAILEFDEKTGQFTNCPEANDLMHYEYRKGWSL